MDDKNCEILRESSWTESIPILQNQKYKVYRKRWWILIMYGIYSMCSIIHGIQYSIIANVVVKFYSVSFEAVDGTAIAFSFFYIIFCIPGTYILDKMGLRISVLIGIVGTCIGSWIKVIAVNPNRFWLAFLGQCIVAIFRVLVIPVPAKLAAIWFGANEVSFACTLGVIAIQVSTALGFILPLLFVAEGSIETIQTGFFHMTYGIAIFTTMFAVILFFFFDDAPPTVPSAAQLLVQGKKKLSFDYKKSLMALLKNKSFVFLIIIYGLHAGTITAITILLNQIILTYYPDAYDDVGTLGFSMVCCGIMGSVLFGVLLRKFGRLKLIARFAFIACTISICLFLFLLDKGLVVIYILAITMSFFWCIIACLGFELSSEICYPEPEAAFGGLLTNFHQVFSITITYFYTFIREDFSEYVGSTILVSILILADVFLFFIKFDLKRSEVDPPNRVKN